MSAALPTSEQMGVSSCFSCALETGEIAFQQGHVITTRHFDVHQDYKIPLAGFLIVRTRRHVLSIADFTPDEEQEFIRVVCEVRRGMREALGIAEVYLFQNEDTMHHFHLWMFPRYPWMEKFGRRIQSVQPIMEYVRDRMDTDENREAVAEATRKISVYMERFT